MLIHTRKQITIFLIDILIIMGAYCGAFLLDFDFRIELFPHQIFIAGFLASLAIKPAVFMMGGV